MKYSNRSILLHIITVPIIAIVGMFTAFGDGIGGSGSPYTCTPVSDSCIARSEAGYPCGVGAVNACEYATGYQGAYSFCILVDQEIVCTETGALSVIIWTGTCSAPPCMCNTGPYGVSRLVSVCN